MKWTKLSKKLSSQQNESMSTYPPQKQSDCSSQQRDEQ